MLLGRKRRDDFRHSFKFTGRRLLSLYRLVKIYFQAFQAIPANASLRVMKLLKNRFYRIEIKLRFTLINKGKCGLKEKSNSRLIDKFFHIFHFFPLLFLPSLFLIKFSDSIQFNKLNKLK